jgi:uncharacterized protein
MPSKPDLQAILSTAQEQKAANEKYLKWLKVKKPQKLDLQVQAAHNQVFSQIDCLECANCCKTTSPIFYPKDIERAAKALRMKAVHFETQYLRIDEDKDYVLQGSPCPFLHDDNYCGIYDSRPTACREYPHTDRKNFIQLTELTYKNTLVCPAVVSIVDKLKLVYPKPE